MVLHTLCWFAFSKNIKATFMLKYTHLNVRSIFNLVYVILNLYDAL